MYGALDIDSIPPATTTRWSPDRIIWIGKLNGPHRRRADLVDRVRRDLDRKAGADRRLARGCLARAALKHLPHDDVLDLVVLEPDTVERVADDDRAELGCLEILQAAAELPERRTDR